MGELEHYLDLFLAVNPHDHHGEHSVSVGELSKILSCSERNVKLILRKLEEARWIVWNPGKGRGNRSKITFLLPLAEAAKRYISELFARGKIALATQFIQQHDVLPQLKEYLNTILQKQFGFHVESGEQKSLDVLRIPRKRKFTSLDPALTFVATEQHFARQIFETLVTYNPITETFEPHLAHTWETDEQREWTFYLRKGVRFHHGRIMTSKDVRYSFERLSSSHFQAPSRWLTDDLQHIEEIGDWAIRFTLKKPNPYFLRLVSSIDLSIVPYDIPIDRGKLIGTGPFKVQEYTEERLIFEAFDDYFKERALLDRIEIWFVPQDNVIQSNYELPHIREMDQSERYVVYEAGCRYLMFNFNKPGPHKDERFRQAFRALLDQEKLISDLGGNRLSPAYSFFPSKSKTMSAPKPNENQAKRWLKESCYMGEEIKIYFFDKTESIQDAEWIKERAQKIGLNVTLHPFPVTHSLVQNIQDADLVIMGEVLDDDLELDFMKLFKDRDTAVYNCLNREQKAMIDQYLQEFMQSTEKGERMQIADQIEAFLREQHILFFLYHVAKDTTIHPALQGVQLNALGWIDFRRLWIKPEIG